MTEERFCPTCEDYRSFREEEREETYTVRGKDVSVTARVLVCAGCGEATSTEGADEDIVRRINDTYRRQEGLLSSDEIRSIRKRYSLSQKSLAHLLEMSEATINRYEQGSIQDRAHDTAIRNCDNPAVIRDLLGRRGEGLSDWQKARVLAALGDAPVDTATPPVGRAEMTAPAVLEAELSEFTGYRKFDFKRYVDVVIAFCKSLNAIPQTKLNKLLFYADFLNYKTASVSITGSKYRKIQFGPVPAQYGWLLQRLADEQWIDVREQVYGNGNTGLEISCGPASADSTPMLTDSEKAVVTQVINALGRLTAGRISERSHNETAWLNTPDRALISYDKADALSLVAM